MKPKITYHVIALIALDCYFWSHVYVVLLSIAFLFLMLFAYSLARSSVDLLCICLRLSQFVSICILFACLFVLHSNFFCSFRFVSSLRHFFIGIYIFKQ